MKKNLILIVTAIVIYALQPASAQNKLAINDRAGFLNEEIESVLRNRLIADSIELTSMIDNRRRCDYWFASLIKEGDEIVMSVLDCNDKSLGTRRMGLKINTAADSEKALLLYFAFSEISGDPYKAETVPGPVKAPLAPATEEEPALPDPGQHRTRYFFAPSSYNLEKGELYYNTLYFFVHDVQYGISDKFSMGMGTTIAGFPFYLTPKITIPAGDKSTFAIGDMLMIGTWGSKFTGNLLYATYTRGGPYNNFTVGLGHLHTGEGDLTQVSNAPVFNFSALLRVSDHIYFITENYSSQVKTKRNAFYNSYNEINGEYIYFDEEFRQNLFFIYGQAGFRFINRTKDVRSWQIGLSYVFSSFEAIPKKYTYSTNWYTNANQGSKLIAFPVIGYARKFSTRY